LFFISYLNKAEKKRKGKTVTTPWTEDPRLFADQGDAPGDCFVLLCIGVYYFLFAVSKTSTVFSIRKIPFFPKKKIAKCSTLVNC
jgi:hypothetical protein